MIAVADPVRVLVADDQTLFRTVLARVLSSDPRVRVVGEARDGLEAVEQARAGKPNVVLMDLQMPRLDGVEAMRLIAREAPDAKIFALSAYADEAMVGEAMSSGAQGFIQKDITFDEILERILNAVPVATDSRQRGRLTDRELQVLRHVAGGLSNKQIAMKLGLSEKTVRNHLSRAFARLGATNRTEAVMSAMRRGLVPA